MDQKMTDQVVVVTGAGRGIGAELSRSLAAEGARLALIDLNPDQVAEQAKTCGAGATGWTADVTDQAQISAAMAAIKQHYGRIDVVVVNAGIGGGGTLRMAEAAEYDRIIEVNLLGSVRTARAAVPYLIESKGYLLQIASAAALLPAPVMASYCASKSGVEAFAHALAGELRMHGVTVGVAYFTWIDTEMVRTADADPGLRATRHSMPWPLNRTYRTDQVVAALAGAVVRRKSHVAFPGWLWFFYGARATTPTVVRRIGSRFTGRYESDKLQRATGGSGTGGSAGEPTS